MIRKTCSVSWFLVGTLALFLTATNSSAGEAGGATVSVDCSKEESINKALEKHPNMDLTIQISGFCQEKVLIRREGVVLRGSDPALDGISGAFEQPLIEIWDAKRGDSVGVADETQFAVELENLGIVGNQGIGVFLYDSGIQIKNCWISDHASTGMHMSGASFALVNDSKIERNSGPGIRSQRQARLVIDNSTFVDNGAWGVVATAGGEAFISDSTFTGNGIDATHAARITGSNSNVTSPGFALRSHTQSRVFWSSSSVSGDIGVDIQSYMRLSDVTQTAVVGQNFASSDSHLHVFGGTLLGNTLFTWFSSGRFLSSGTGPATLGDLICNNGSDAFCGGSETKNSSSCSLCP